MNPFLKKAGAGVVLLLFLFAIVSFSEELMGESLASTFWVYSKKPKTGPPEEAGAKPLDLLFVGDMMFDRGVEAVRKKEEDGFLFSRVTPFFGRFDKVVGNLEGPVVSEPVFFGPHSMRFSFGREVASLLANNGVTHLSLANNHTLDMGKKGFQATSRFLKEAGLASFGHPVREGGFELKEERMLLLGLNRTSGLDPRRAKELVRSRRRSCPERFLVVFMHWGEEYEPESSPGQRELGHGLVKAGADLVIGSHPHVVQEVEKYEGSLIFYSLGNFIFDQFFSRRTQRGLAVGVKIKREELLYTLYPLGSEKAQPFLLRGEKRDRFLEKLAAKSGKHLQEEVKSGKIKVKRKD